jgi:hypothetical protein
MKNSIIKICRVISVEDPQDGERIKVRLSPYDNRLTDSELPYAFPLLPKMLHVKPKVGESVLIVLANMDDGTSMRYYIGPVISQPQNMDFDEFGTTSLSLHDGNIKAPETAPSFKPESKGALAGDEDVAIYGREKSDIVMTDNSVRIRCGSRIKDGTDTVAFNRNSPSYIHLRHRDEVMVPAVKDNEYQSTATIVADKINLIGNDTTEITRVTSQEHLIDDGTMNNIIEKAHQLPYGDILIEFLTLFIKAFGEHTHAFPMDPPVPTTDYLSLIGYDLEKILSKTVRIT